MITLEPCDQGKKLGINQRLFNVNSNNNNNDDDDDDFICILSSFDFFKHKNLINSNSNDR